MILEAHILDFSRMIYGKKMEVSFLKHIRPFASAKTDWRKMQHNTDFSPWQGQKLYGSPKYTVLRGQVIAEEGELTHPKTFTGQFQRRIKPQII